MGWPQEAERNPLWPLMSALFTFLNRHDGSEILRTAPLASLGTRETCVEGGRIAPAVRNELPSRRLAQERKVHSSSCRETGPSRALPWAGRPSWCIDRLAVVLVGAQNCWNTQSYCCARASWDVRLLPYFVTSGLDGLGTSSPSSRWAGSRVSRRTASRR